VNRRPAYTLFELLLTTAVIAVTAAVTVPSLDAMYPGYKLNASVDAVRAAWAQGRARAIEEGRPYRFAVTPGGGDYRLAPDDGPSDGRPAGGFHIEDRLPQGVTFAAAQDDGPQADGLSTVAIFLPDGTARDDAEIHFQIQGARPKCVRLRGLTGAVTVQEDGGGAR
jgi:Tfp pilus assembly protein FimT